MAYDIFISYSRRDSETVDELCRWLKLKGISYFIDRRDIAGGMEFPDEIANAINGSRLLLFVASRNSYQSRFTRNEILYALQCKGPNHVVSYIIDDSSLPLMFRTKLQHSDTFRLDSFPIYPNLIDILRAKTGKKSISHLPDHINFKSSAPVLICEQSNRVQNYCFSSDGTMICLCGYDGEIKILNPVSGRMICSFSLPIKTIAQNALFSSDGSILFSVHKINNSEGIIARWSIERRCLIEYKPLKSGLCNCLIITSDRKHLIAAHQSVGIIDSDSLELLKEFDLMDYADELDIKAYSDPYIYDIRLTDEDSSIILSSSAFNVSKLSLYKHECNKLFPANSIACLSTKVYATVNRDHVALYDYTSQPRQIRKFYSKDENFCSVAFNSDESLLGAGDVDSNIYVWDIRSGRIKLSARIPKAGRISHICFSLDSKLLAVSAENGMVYIFRSE